MPHTRDTQTDALARIAYRETLAIRKDLKAGFAAVRRDIRNSQKTILAAVRATNVKSTVHELEDTMAIIKSRLATIERRLGIEAAA